MNTLKAASIACLVFASSVGGPNKTRAFAKGGQPNTMHQSATHRIEKKAAKDFLATTDHLSRLQREQVIRQWLKHRLVPDFLWQFREIELHEIIDGKVYQGSLYVAPEYLALGTDQDFMLIPVNFETIAFMIKEWRYLIPTRKIVDLIHEQREQRFWANPLKPGPTMHSNAYYQKHHALSSQQRLFFPMDTLVSGHKKDIVLSNRLKRKPHRIAIYGWRSWNDRRIQPLSIVHGKRYVDYSHGVRLVHPIMTVNGQELPVTEVLKDPTLSALISDEGPIHLKALLPEIPKDEWWHHQKFVH